MSWFYLAVSAAILTGVSVVLQKQVLKKEHAVQNALVIAIGQAGISVFLLPFMNFKGFDPGVLFFALMSTLSTAAAAVYGAKAIRNLEVSLAAPFFALGTVFLVVLSFIFLGERLLPIETVGIIVILAGAYVVDFEGKSLLDPIRSLTNRYVRDDLLSVALYSFGFLFAKPVLDKTDPLSLLVLQNFIMAAALLIYSGSRHPITKDVVGAVRKDGWMHLLISVFTFGQAFLVFFAVKQQDVSLVVPIYRMWILVAIIIGGRMFKEHNIKYRFAGALLMLAGVYLVANPM